MLSSSVAGSSATNIGRTQRRQRRTMSLARFLFCLVWASLCLLSCSTINAADATEADVDCPGPDEAFVTTCSGSERSSSPPNDEAASFDESDLVNEVLEDSQESKPKRQPRKQKARSGAGAGAPTPTNNSGEDEPGYFDATTESSSDSMQQLKQTTTKLIRKYYDPLPRQGKCAMGTVCGFAASRLTMGVANRLFRLAGATWVLSEALHASGMCDEARCVPEEARPWVGILRRSLIKQCRKIRLIARRIWDEDRIREIAEKDEMVAGGFAAGAFVGFVV